MVVNEVVGLRCIRPDLKNILLAEVDDPGLRALPKCGDGSAIGFVSMDRRSVYRTPPPAAEPGMRRKRAPSEYNIFIGGCMKAKTGVAFPERMKSCAIEYKQKKGTR